MERAINFCNANKNTCKDIKFAIFDLFDSKELWDFADKPDENCIGEYTPLNDGDRQSDKRHYHTRRCAEVIRRICPEAKIYVMQSTDKSYEWCGNNGIHILSVSLTGTRSSDQTELKFEDKIFNLISAGNDGHYGDDTMSATAKKKHWTSIGAVQLLYFYKHADGSVNFDRPKLRTAYYSSKGEELDFCGLTRLMLSDGEYFEGTSCAEPDVAGLLGQYMQSHKDFFGYMPSVEKIYQFMRNNVIDIGPSGFDIDTGYGLFTLPKEIKFTTDPKNIRRARFERFVLTVWPNGLTEKRKKQLFKLWGTYLGLEVVK